MTGATEVGCEGKADGETSEEMDAKRMETRSCPCSHARNVKAKVGHRNLALGFPSREPKRWKPKI